MTRKEQQAVAEVLRDYSIGMNRDNYVNLCERMAIRLSIASRSFNRAAFMETCGVSDGALR